MRKAAKITTTTCRDYYPYGMEMPGRSYEAGGYRFGFNGKEADPEAVEAGSQYDYGFRIYNTALARFLSVDPLTAGYPWYTPYQFAGNKPIWAIDLDGLEPVIATHAESSFDRKKAEEEIQRLLESAQTESTVYIIVHVYENGTEQPEGSTFHGPWVTYVAGRHITRIGHSDNICIVDVHCSHGGVQWAGSGCIQVPPITQLNSLPASISISQMTLPNINPQSRYSNNLHVNNRTVADRSTKTYRNIFEGNSDWYANNANADRMLKEIASILNANPDQTVTITGHTGEDGNTNAVGSNTNYNMRIGNINGRTWFERNGRIYQNTVGDLMDLRADRVRSDLINLYGVDPKQISTKRGTNENSDKHRMIEVKFSSND